MSRQHKVEATLYKRLYEEATKPGAKHLHDIMTVEIAQRFIAEAALEAQEKADQAQEKAEVEARDRAVARRRLVETTEPTRPNRWADPEKDAFKCFECGRTVNWGSSECRHCGTRYRYDGGRARRDD